MTPTEYGIGYSVWSIGSWTRDDVPIEGRCVDRSGCIVASCISGGSAPGGGETEDRS